MAPHQIRQYKATNRQSIARVETQNSLTIAEARTPKSFMFRPAVPDLA